MLLDAQLITPLRILRRSDSQSYTRNSVCDLGGAVAGGGLNLAAVTTEIDRQTARDGRLFPSAF